MNKPKFILISGGIAAAASVVAAVIHLTTTVSYAKMTAELPKGFTVTAHTGCEGTKDNTVECISAGAAAGADVVEIDLHFLADGTPVLSHDAPAESATAENTVLLESAFEELAKYNLRMNVDVKSTANIPAVVQCAYKYGVADRIFFTGVEEKKVEAVKAGAPGIAYYLNVDVDKNLNKDYNYLESLIEKVKSCGAIGINLNFRSCSEELVRFFRSEGLLVSVWTANKKKDMLKCLDLAPDNITTRKPSILCDIIGRAEK